METTRDIALWLSLIFSVGVLALFCALLYTYWTTVCARSRFPTMRALARRVDKSHSVAFEIATNPRVAESELALLSDDTNQYIRALVARHPRVPSDTIRALAQDSSSMVRRSVMLNPYAPDDVVTLLALEMMVETDA